MTKYRGVELEPKLATRQQTKTIQEILAINEGLAEVLQRRDELFARLEKDQGCPLVAKVKVRGEEGERHGEYRTFVVDKPKGHFVFYKLIDFTMNTKTSKDDRLALGLKTRIVKARGDEVQEVPRGEGSEKPVEGR